MADATAAPELRDAASVILLRSGPDGHRVLMGRRGAAAAFMPSKFVFPGGAVDPADAATPLADPPSPVFLARLEGRADLAVAAIREVWEETGLALARPGIADLPAGWEGMAARGLVPSAAGLRFVFRAITPPGRSRRFDARFFLCDATAIHGDLDDFSAASDELAALRWLTLAETRTLDLPFITEVVLAEVAAHAAGRPPGPVPFFDNRGAPAFRRID